MGTRENPLDCIIIDTVCRDEYVKSNGFISQPLENGELKYHEGVYATSIIELHYDMLGDDSTKTLRTCLHEFAHALGLDHTAVPYSVMCNRGRVVPAFLLTPWDIVSQFEASKEY
ncbi:MAG: matrixin family metalloprotease [Clostridia bacterium]|nr:matrixin family metalloprotease [Clostridia bacterium]